MEWVDEGYVLSAMKYGERDAIVTLLTKEHGRHKGLLKNGMTSKVRGGIQPGSRLHVHWKARLEEHLGNWKVELLWSPLGGMYEAPLALKALLAGCALCDSVLPEREPQPQAFDKLQEFLSPVEGQDWGAAYLNLEVFMLDTLGFGLQLESCAVTGKQGELPYISPNTGRAVSLEAGLPYARKLLPNSPALRPKQGSQAPQEVVQAYGVTHHFLSQNVWQVGQRNQKSSKNQDVSPPARQRLLAALRKTL